MISQDILDSIDRIVQYAWSAERADYDREGRPENHIFPDLEAVNNWLLNPNQKEASCTHRPTA